MGRFAGQRLAILSAKSGELSNDHYGLYDVRFAESQPTRWHATAHHVYFEDIAGVEGLRWWVAAIDLFIAGTLVVVMLMVAWSLVRLGAGAVRIVSR